jgi:U32 family peptidase
MAKHGAHGFLVRNLASVAFCKEEGIPFTCDYSLNAANQWTVDYLRSRGAERVTVSYDLNRDQLLDLVAAVPPAWLEVVIHQHMPMFHMEHCVFAAFLSNGKDWRDCGRPCDRHKIELRDRVGAEFPVTPDAGCRNTVFNSVPQSAAEYVPHMLALGLRRFRVELLRETAEEVGLLINAYRRVIEGTNDGRETWRSLRAMNQLGVTRGTLQLV